MEIDTCDSLRNAKLEKDGGSFHTERQKVGDDGSLSTPNIEAKREPPILWISQIPANCIVHIHMLVGDES